MNLEYAHLPRLLMQCIVVIALSWPMVSGGQASLSPARDLQADANLVANTRVPLIVLVSLAGCPHCEIVRRSHLLPLLREGRLPQRAMIRQVEMNGREFLQDFNGNKTTHGEFARRYRVSIAPVVLFFDASGQMAADSLVGTMIPEFYGAYFEAALAEATLKVQRVN